MRESVLTHNMIKQKWPKKPSQQQQKLYILKIWKLFDKAVLEFIVCFQDKSSATVIDDGPEIEYVPEDISIPVGDPSYASFTKIFEAFRVSIVISSN